MPRIEIAEISLRSVRRDQNMSTEASCIHSAAEPVHKVYSGAAHARAHFKDVRPRRNRAPRSVPRHTAGKGIP
jgi:hypothetical protein